MYNKLGQCTDRIYTVKLQRMWTLKNVCIAIAGVGNVGRRDSRMNAFYTMPIWLINSFQSM